MSCKIFSGKRGNGKTSELIKIAHDEGLYIVCLNNQRRNLIRKMAHDMKLSILDPVILPEAFHWSEGNMYKLTVNKLLVDDADDILSFLFGGMEIEAITVTADGTPGFTYRMSSSLWQHCPHCGANFRGTIVFGEIDDDEL